MTIVARIKTRFKSWFIRYPRSGVDKERRTGDGARER